MIGFRVALFLVATLVLWYLGNFALRAAWAAFDLPAVSPLARVLNLALLPVSALVAWAILRKVPDEMPRGGRRSAAPPADGGPEER